MHWQLIEPRCDKKKGYYIWDMLWSTHCGRSPLTKVSRRPRPTPRTGNKNKAVRRLDSITQTETTTLTLQGKHRRVHHHAAAAWRTLRGNTSTLASGRRLLYCPRPQRWNDYYFLFFYPHVFPLSSIGIVFSVKLSLDSCFIRVSCTLNRVPYKQNCWLSRVIKWTSFIRCKRSFVPMKLMWLCYLIYSVGNCAMKLCIEALFSFPLKFFYPSHRIFGHMHGTLNVHKKVNQLHSLVKNRETNLLSLVTSWLALSATVTHIC